MAPVNAWSKAFNTAQTAFPTDAFTEDCTLIDELRCSPGDHHARPCASGMPR